MRLSRITSGGKVIPEVEGLRFIAIVVVVLHHLIGNIFTRAHLPFRPIGRFGVMLFFSISGFILALRFAQQYLGGGSRVGIKRHILLGELRDSNRRSWSMPCFFCR
jgi:peptidoglycan/LPS O-acetylase OafA/YrhL